MAKRFKDLSGVILTETYAYRGVKQVNETKYAYGSKEYSYSIKSHGDTMYMLDKSNNYEIVELVVKTVSVSCWNGKASIKACKSSDAEKLKDYMPYHYGNKSNEQYDKYFIRFEVRGNRSHAGLFFTELKEAEKYQKQLRGGFAFIYLKPGDSVYLVLNGSELIEAEVERTDECIDGRDNQFNLWLKKYGRVFFNNSRYEERVTDLLESYYYTYQMNFEKEDGNHWHPADIKIFLRKSDAEKTIKEVEQRKRSSATSKYLKEIENHDGKPISFSDSKGKQLHYGDKVAYAVSGGSSSPFISFGIVKGESKTKVSIVDETKKDYEGNPEKHSVSPVCILLVKEAEFNTKSGYSFVKAK